MKKVSVGRETVVLSRQIIKLRNKCLKDYGCEISEAHVHAFFYFVRNSGCTEKQAVQAVGKDKTNIAKSVKKLIAQGMITSIPDESDARYKRIRPTRKGEKEAIKVKKALNNISVIMSGGLEKEQIEAYLQTLEIMRKNIQTNLESG